VSSVALSQTTAATVTSSSVGDQVITKAPAVDSGFTAALALSKTYTDGIFSDVASDAWYAAAVQFVYEYGIMNGTAPTLFSPDGNTSRAQIITILARLSGLDTDGGETWFSKAVAWAQQNGVSDGADPEGDVTREQFITMLWRFAGEPKIEADTGVSMNFTDVGAISEWALDAMKWAVSIGLLQGYSDGSIKPGDLATRAETAALIERYLKS
jgi:hypothetical protein